jgi:hypothetical protein
MQNSQRLILAGASIGIALIVLGVVAISTSSWLILTVPGAVKSTYSLFDRCNTTSIAALAPIAGCRTLNGFQTEQGLIIAGVIAAGLGIIASILLGILYDNKWIKVLPQILLIIGPTLILIGLLFYVKNVLENFTSGSAELDLGYSIILIVVTCIIGYISAAYFLFINGLSQGNHGGRIFTSSGN